MHLPPGTFEEAAKHLPVTFDTGLGLFLWDTSNPLFDRIVSSTAYLAFTFASRTATNITIRVPFRLPNLTLTAPLVDEPTAYFPCRPFASNTGVVVGTRVSPGCVLRYQC